MASAQWRGDGRLDLVHGWGDWSTRIIAAAAVIGMATAAWNWSSSTMNELQEVRAKVAEHDGGFDRMERKIDSLNDNDRKKFEMLNDLKVVGMELKTTADNNSKRLDRIEAKQDRNQQQRQQPASAKVDLP